jgi:hypothetical protein
MINLITADNGANRLPYLGHKPVLGHAHGGFSSGTPKGDFQSMIASPWWESARLLVPVIAFCRFKLPYYMMEFNKVKRLAQGGHS